MTKTTKFPHLIETPDGRHGVALGDGLVIRWWQAGDKWNVQVESDNGLDVLGVHREKATMTTH